jgi:hypothetical protein
MVRSVSATSTTVIDLRRENAERKSGSQGSIPELKQQCELTGMSVVASMLRS